MGLGQIGRHLYQLAAESDDIEIVAVADIGKPEILHYLLKSDNADAPQCELHDNYLVNNKFRTRMLQIAKPGDVPWDIFGVDCVIDATGRYRRREYLETHLQAGAGRVILASLPAESIDRVLVPGINEASAVSGDRLISAGSATTNALALILYFLDAALGSRLRVDDNGPCLQQRSIFAGLCPRGFSPQSLRCSEHHPQQQ